ncbi:MAG: DUF1893 domain-containing protein [Prevotellaceae bacterium]|nr:DUF1893 domain-containing protein [Prevotellaceae bacterium]
MNKLIQILHTGKYSCVIANGNDVRTFSQRGVNDLYDLYNQDPAFLQGASIADKIVGKAAAALMILGGIKKLYTGVISESALEILQNSGIELTYGKVVPFVENRAKTASCPMEAACKEAKTAAEVYAVIEQF